MEHWSIASVLRSISSAGLFRREAKNNPALLKLPKYIKQNQILMLMSSQARLASFDTSKVPQLAFHPRTCDQPAKFNRKAWETNAVHFYSYPQCEVKTAVVRFLYHLIPSIYPEFHRIPIINVELSHKCVHPQRWFAKKQLMHLFPQCDSPVQPDLQNCCDLKKQADELVCLGTFNLFQSLK